MSILIYVIPFLLIMTILISVHELGHYFIARKIGVKVQIFSIGFGKELFGYTDKNGTRWRLSLLPFGGYVMMLGDGDISSTKINPSVLKESSKEETLFGKTPIQRIAVSIGGPLANYVYAFLMFVFLYSVVGQPYLKPIVSEVFPNSPAASAGLMSGDEFININGENVETFQEVQEKVQKNESLSVIVLRNNERTPIEIIPQQKNDRKIIGVSTAGEIGYKRKNPIAAVTTSLQDCFYISCEIAKSLFNLFIGKQPLNSLLGPIRIAEVSGSVSKSGNIYQIILFTALLSINLGFINLIPLPVLDGGGIVLNLIDMVYPLTAVTKERIIKISFALIITLMLFTTFNDLVHLGIGMK